MAVTAKTLGVHFAYSLVIVAASSLGAAMAQMPVTQLKGVFPSAAEVGGTAKVEVLGQGPLEEIDRLIFSHPGITASVEPGESDPLTNQTSIAYGRFNVSVASDVAPGFYQVWAAGRHGVSSSRIFWISPRPVLAIASIDSQKPPELALGQIVTKRLTAAQVDPYVVRLEAGQKVRISLCDGLLDSRALCLFRVLDPNQRAISEVRSSGRGSLHSDIQAASAGLYRIEVRDEIYRGGDEYVYSLALEKPEEASLLPTESEWTNREQVLRALTSSDGRALITRQLATAALPRILPVDAQWFFTKSNDTEALTVSPPCVVAGRFARTTGQQIEFTAKKGDVYWIDIVSAQLGEATDPLLSIFKVVADDKSAKSEGGKPSIKLERVAEQDDGPASGSAPFAIRRTDPSVRVEVPSDGTYRLVVRDQFASNPARLGGKFLVSIRPPAPGLIALAGWVTPTNNAAQSRPTGSNLLPGGTAAIRIQLTRYDGLTGPVEVTIPQLPTGVTCSPILIPADRDEGHLVVTAAETANPARFNGPLTIMARCLGSTSVETRAAVVEINWEAMPTWNAITSRLSQQLMLDVSDKDVAPVTFAVGSGDTLVMARGGKLPIPIRVTRRGATKDKAVLRPQGLPAKTTLGEVTIEGKDEEAKPELQVAADAPLGETSFWFQVETKVKFRNNAQALQRAESAKAALEKLQADPNQAAQKEAIAKRITAVDESIKQLKDSTGEKDVAVFIPTNTVRVRVVEGAIEPTALWKFEGTRGSEADYALGIKRLFGLEGPIEIQLVEDKASAGVAMAPVTIAAGSDMTMCHIKIASDAAVGERTVQLKLSYEFHKQKLSVTLPLVVRVGE